MNEETLIQEFLEGNEEAFRELVNQYQSPLLNYLYRFTNDYDLAEEITQETFMIVFQNLHKLKKETSFRSWIYAIATNRAIRIGKKRSPIYNEETLQHIAIVNPDPTHNIDQTERAVAVQKALATLPESHRAVFILRFYQGLSYDEISKTIGCPLGTVKSRMCLSLKKLRGILSEYEES